MAFNTWLVFLLAAVLISISPGAGAVNTMSNGLRYGVRHSLPAILGLQLGLGAQIVLVGIGLGALLGSSEIAFSLVKWVGVAYLMWLGWQKFREGALQLDGEKGKVLSSHRRFWQATVVNLTNPKATVFLVALFPQFVDATAPHVPQFVIMGATMIVVDIVVMVGYATLATQILKVLRTPRQQRHLNRVFGGFFMGAAAALAAFRN